jgi:hypothetical protein
MIGKQASPASHLFFQTGFSLYAAGLLSWEMPSLYIVRVFYTLTDSMAPAGSGQSTPGRIVHLRAHYDAQHSVYELQLVLEGM